MSNYEIAKKWIECPNNIPFIEYANITEGRWSDFYKFISSKYCASWGNKECQKYINFIDYIRSKL